MTNRHFRRCDGAPQRPEERLRPQSDVWGLSCPEANHRFAKCSVLSSSAPLSIVASSAVLEAQSEHSGAIKPRLRFSRTADWPGRTLRYVRLTGNYRAPVVPELR